MFFELFVSNGWIAVHSFYEIMALLSGFRKILEGIKETAAFYLLLAIKVAKAQASIRLPAKSSAHIGSIFSRS